MHKQEQSGGGVETEICLHGQAIDCVDKAVGYMDKAVGYVRHINGLRRGESNAVRVAGVFGNIDTCDMRCGVGYARGGSAGSAKSKAD